MYIQHDHHATDVYAEYAIGKMSRLYTMFMMIMQSWCRLYTINARNDFDTFTQGQIDILTESLSTIHQYSIKMARSRVKCHTLMPCILYSLLQVLT